MFGCFVFQNAPQKSNKITSIDVDVSSGDGNWLLFAVYGHEQKIVKLPLKMDYTVDDNARLLKPGEKGDKPNESNGRKKRDVYQVKTSGVEDLVRYCINL